MTTGKTTMRRRALLTVLIAVFVLALVSLGTYRALVVPQGNAFDFYTLWHGGRVFWAGENPYSLDTAREIQQAVFGELRPESENQQGYAYPAYAALILAPFLLMPFPIAAAIWTALSLIGLGAAAVLTALALDWRPRPIALLMLLLGVYFYRYALIVVVIGQMQAVVCLSLALALFLYHRQHDRWAGLALVFSAIRPEFGLPLGLVMSVLALRAGRRQVGIAWLAGLATISLVALIRRPTWPLDFLAGLRLYSGYAPVSWPFALFGIWGLAAAGLILVLAIYILVTQRPSLSDPLYATAFLIPLLLTFLPQTGSYTLTLALFPFVVAVAHTANAWSRAVAVAMLVAPWVVWTVSRTSPDLMPTERLVVPVLAMLALSLSLRRPNGTLHRAAGVQ